MTPRAAELPSPPRPVAPILPSEGGERKQFASLKAACSAAKNNDVIELQYNGLARARAARAGEPEVDDSRAATGFRPVIAFRPGQLGLAGFGRSMITVTGGRLTLLESSGLCSIFPRDAAAEGWSLFETRQDRTTAFRGMFADDSQPGRRR